jgi:hypothetical protein
LLSNIDIGAEDRIQVILVEGGRTRREELADDQGDYQDHEKTVKK